MNGNINSTEEEEEEAAIKDTPQFFYASIAKIAVAQICQSLGFTGSQKSALEALSNIATRHLQTLARSASIHANSCCRTTCNVFDVIHAIEDMNSIQGFEGYSNVSRPLLKSGIIKELIVFVRSIEEIPFAKPLPRRNGPKRSDFPKRVAKSRHIQDAARSYSHIPHWLPDLPDPSTYRNVESRVSRGDRSQVHEEDKNEVLDESIYRNAEKGINWEQQQQEEKKTMMILSIEREKVRFKLGKGFRASCRNECRQ